MEVSQQSGIYGTPLPELAPMPTAAQQFSPLMPGAQSLENCLPGSLGSFVLQAPPGTVERRYVMALALRALAPIGEITVLAPKDRGGTRLMDELENLGCQPTQTARRHHKICTLLRPARLEGIDQAIAEGAPRIVEGLGLWSQPGLFNWDRTDPGSVLLSQHLPEFAGHGADFGCGFGFLALKVLTGPKVKSLTLIDIDRRAVEAAAHNFNDPRISTRWADVRKLGISPNGLDFIVMNPPVHEAGEEDRGLGQTFIREAAARLRQSGTLWLTANRHLPYEAVLKPLFRRIRPVADAGGFKIVEAQK